jgi:hypothetical protein
MHAGGALALILAASGCSRASDHPGDAAPSTPASAVPSASAASSGPADAAAGNIAWHGTYKSVPGTVTIPSSLKAGTWANADTQAALGEGNLTLVVDGSSGRVTGSLDGPLGPASVAGLFADGRITAVVRRIDPADEGFTGTLEASRSGAKLEGTMNGALARANAVRSATFALAGGEGAPGAEAN